MHIGDAVEAFSGSPSNTLPYLDFGKKKRLGREGWEFHRPSPFTSPARGSRLRGPINLTHRARCSGQRFRDLLSPCPTKGYRVEVPVSRPLRHHRNTAGRALPLNPIPPEFTVPSRYWLPLGCLGDPFRADTPGAPRGPRVAVGIKEGKPCAGRGRHRCERIRHGRGCRRRCRRDPSRPGDDGRGQPIAIFRRTSADGLDGWRQSALLGNETTLC